MQILFQYFFSSLVIAVVHASFTLRFHLPESLFRWQRKIHKESFFFLVVSDENGETFPNDWKPESATGSPLADELTIYPFSWIFVFRTKPEFPQNNVFFIDEKRRGSRLQEPSTEAK